MELTVYYYYCACAAILPTLMEHGNLGTPSGQAITQTILAWQMTMFALPAIYERRMAT
jgi:hypothetical protein